MGDTKQEIGEIPAIKYRCRCGHEWYPRNPDERPRVCPHCKSANWDKPYKFRRGKK
jgi:predicted Zn-ribbon and HTH transcriptional regulator